MPAIDLTIDLTGTTNQVFFPLYDDRSPYLVLYGGGGSGKSVFAAQKIIARIIEEQDHSFLVVRKVQRTVRDSVFAMFRKLVRQYGLAPLTKIVESPTPRITFPHFRSEIIFAGLDDEEKLKSITSTITDTLTGIWAEEPTEMTQDDFEQLTIRLRGATKHYQQIVLTFNPIHEQHWLKSYWFDKPRDDARVLKTTYKDNRFLTDTDRKRLEDLRETNLNKYRVYCLGEWGSYGDLVFDAESWVAERIRYTEQDFDRVLNGMDFGYKAPSAIVRVGVKDDELYVFDEFYEKELINPLLVEATRNFLPPGSHITAESAEPDRIEEFNRAGFRVDPVKDKGRQSSIDWLKSKKIHIDNRRCPNLIREFETLEWRKDRSGRFIEGEFAVLADDHAVDALRYAVEPLRHAAEPARAFNPLRR